MTKGTVPGSGNPAAGSADITLAESTCCIVWRQTEERKKEKQKDRKKDRQTDRKLRKQKRHE